MPDTLKSFFSRSLIREIAASIAKVHSEFDESAFVRDASAGLEKLELLGRGHHIASALREHLPARYVDALKIILRSLGKPHGSDELKGAGMTPFFYLPHVFFVANYGLEDFQASMDAQHVLTQRFTCEFTIRPYLERYPDATLKILHKWTKDPNPHVRRLASEGTRPRLPWAPRVRWIANEPQRILPILEALKDDSASVVRRSVANSINDISKSHPDLAVQIAKDWLKDADANRLALIKHALRTSIKRADKRALALLGFGKRARVRVASTTIQPKRVPIGGKVSITFELESTGPKEQALAVDLMVFFVKSNGTARPKVFKMGTAELAAGSRSTFRKSISLAIHTTRIPYAGKHTVRALINGDEVDLGSFVVTR